MKNLRKPSIRLVSRVVNWLVRKGWIKSPNLKPLLKVSQICSLLGLSELGDFEPIKDSYVADSFLLDKLENQSELKIQLKLQKGYFQMIRQRLVWMLKAKADDFRKRYDKFSPANQTAEELVQYYVEWLYAFEPLGFSVNDFFDYELYNKSLEQAVRFVDAAYKNKIQSVCSTVPYGDTHFRNKAGFNRFFRQFVTRDWLDTTACTLEDFTNFANRHGLCFAKPVAGSRGRGARVLQLEDDFEGWFVECQQNKLLVEEMISQHLELAEFNQSTVNTVRLYTLLTASDQPTITLAIVRFGRRGHIVDNYHAGGLAASVDVASGLISAEAVDRNHHRFRLHPDSQKQFEGFRIPNWQQACQAVTEAVKSMPYVRHVAWDLAITDAGRIEFVEGNHWPDFDVTQVVDQVGKKHLYVKPIAELEARS